jgi:hypothetical protein
MVYDVGRRSKNILVGVFALWKIILLCRVFLVLYPELFKAILQIYLDRGLFLFEHLFFYAVGWQPNHTRSLS